jgi:hypothetical protein
MTMKRAATMADLSEEVMHCRAFGHQWQDHGATRVGKGLAQGWRVTMVCSSCATLKLFTLGRQGQLDAPRYIYPDFYLAKFFIGSDERAAMRLGALRELLEKPSLKLVN